MIWVVARIVFAILRIWPYHKVVWIPQYRFVDDCSPIAPALELQLLVDQITHPVIARMVEIAKDLCANAIEIVIIHYFPSKLKTNVLYCKLVMIG